jgi:hypothetical protein
MDDIAEIKTRVEHLKPEQQAELLAWLLERDQQAWDTQIECDLADGKLDALIAEARADRDAGRGRDL